MTETTKDNRRLRGFGPTGVSVLAPFPPLASDNVDSNNVAFPTTFPYLAVPNGG